jgi:adenine-specific DNA methylase
MKFMGSKRLMLQNGLGTLLRREAKRHRRFVDLFSGSSAVGWFVASQTRLPVTSVDLQSFAGALAASVVLRRKPLDARGIQEKLIWGLISGLNGPEWTIAQTFRLGTRGIRTTVTRARRWCSRRSADWPITRAYGGHYFSPTQAMSLDAVLRSLPTRGDERRVLLAATIVAAAKCAASPGHTAQPFQPTTSARLFLRDKWSREAVGYLLEAVTDIANLRAQRPGRVIVGDALAFARHLKKTDLVFVDPPYSSVHYSRFYHVLETIARGKCGPVSGTGRYPPSSERPLSKFSIKGLSRPALAELLIALHEARCTVVLTFPYRKCSNGLSGQLIKSWAHTLFRARATTVKTRFSTLGGSDRNRGARLDRSEMILILRPRKTAAIGSLPTSP